MRRLLIAVSLVVSACSAPAPCECTLANGISLACGRGACVDGTGWACVDGAETSFPAACGLDGGVPVDDTGVPVDAPTTPACAFPLIVRSGTTATINAPTPGACVGDLAVVCAAGPVPGEGHELRVTCASDEECRSFTMEAYVSPSASSTDFTRVGSYVWARCVPRGAEAIAYAFHGSTWTTTATRMCDGADRVSPVGFADLSDTTQPTIMAMDSTTPANVVVGSTDGFLARNACASGERCVTSGSSLACVGATAMPCTLARCSGTTLIGCRDGYERPAVDCGATGEICFAPPLDTAACFLDAEHAASCQPPGTMVCPTITGDACAADRHSYTTCRTDACVAGTMACASSETCYMGRCIDDALYCDPSTTPSTCSGNTVHWCGFGGVRTTNDCTAFGMTCTTVADASAPGGMRAGCVSSVGDSPCAILTGRCDGNTALRCCDTGGIFTTSSRPFTTIACIPHEPVSDPCNTTCNDTGHFGPTCD